MGRCSCSGQQLVIEAGDGVTITGAGTAKSPLIINAASGPGGSSGWDPGDVKWSARPGAKPGWLVADGRAVSRTTYSALFAAIGTTHGPGDGSTTFNLPDLTGKFALGADGGHPLGSSGGLEAVTLAANNVPSHTHTMEAGGAHSHNPYHNDADGSASEVYRMGSRSGRTTAVGGDGGLVQGTGGHSHTIQPNAGGGAPVPIMPPYSTATPLVKT